MLNVRTRAALLSLGLLFAAAGLAGSPAPASRHPLAGFLDPHSIHLSPTRTEAISPELLQWGREVVADLGLAALSPGERARRIASYIHRRFSFTPDRNNTTDDFRRTLKGNCWDHARMAIFLLRLAGVPAKFGYEIHLELKTPASAESARKAGTGLFGNYHNDHAWVWFHDGGSWLPLDSALGIVGYEEFKRHKVLYPAGGSANPPFVIWEDTGTGTADMKNVTLQVWDRLRASSISKVPEEDWRSLLELFSQVSLDAVRKQVLPPQLQARIAAVAEKFFSGVGVTVPPEQRLEEQPVKPRGTAWLLGPGGSGRHGAVTSLQAAP